MVNEDRNRSKQASDQAKQVNVEFVENQGRADAPGQPTALTDKTPETEEIRKDYEKKIEELEEKHLRLLAEFQNYKRRVEREQLELADFIKGEIFKKLLPVLDDFKIMMDNAAAGANEQSMREGARIIYEKLKTILEKEGLEKIESLGETFNPEIHEALMTRPTKQKEEHEKVVEVYQEGYRLKEKLLRPSKVVVGKYSQEENKYSAEG